MTAMIKVEHLKKSFGKKEVLKDISANVDIRVAQESVGLISVAHQAVWRWS